MDPIKLPGGNCLRRPLRPAGGIPRRLFGWLVGALAAIAIPALAQMSAPPLRFGVTPAIVHDQYGVLDDWRVYLERKLDRKLEFVSRDSYRDTIDLIKDKKLDFAWVSTSPYVYLQQKGYAALLATPLYRGRPYYRAYFIVPASDRATTTLLQLEGRVFAYADLYSNTGYLVPRSLLRQAGKDENSFFRKTFFTWSHRKVVMAVAEGLADGGSIDSFVWDTLSVIRPELTSQTRIVAESEEYGFPPIVANAATSRQEVAAMLGALTGMAGDPEGSVLLKRLNIDGFIRGNARLYERVVEMQRVFGEL